MFQSQTEENSWKPAPMGPKMRTMEFDAAWSKLEVAMDKICGHNGFTITEYMAFYSIVVEFCMDESNSNHPDTIGIGKADIIYDALQKFLRSFLRAEAAKIAELHADDDRLRQYKTAWEKFEFSAQVASGVFRYLNRHWVARYNEHVVEKKNKKRGPDSEPMKRAFEINTLCMVLWKEELFEKAALDITRSALNLMNRDRDGESGVDDGLIKALVNSLVALGVEFRRDPDPLGMCISGTDVVNKNSNSKLTSEALEMLQTYEKYFEVAMLEETRNYYAKEPAAVIEDGDIIGYMRKTEERLNEEVERSRRYLHDVLSNERLQKAVEQAYIEERLSLFRGEFRNLLVAERIADMNLMFRLCSRVEKAINQLRADFRDYVAEKGREAIANIPSTEQNDPATYVHTVLRVHDKYRELVKEAFDDEAGFTHHFGMGCTMMVNKNKITDGARSLNKTSELLGRFVDVMMRKGGNEDFEKTIDQAMTFFIYIEDKDIFQKYYNKFLAKRLLMERSVNDDAEGSMITRLKTACGHEYTTTAMKMFQDMTVSKTATSEFREKCGEENEIDAHFQILSTGSWPYTQSQTFNIPPVLEQTINKFTSYYIGVHQGRKLNWLLNASRGEVTTNGFGRKYTLSVSTAQMVVLLKYNEGDSFAFPTLLGDLNMADEELRNVLASLVKADLLKRSADDEYKLNKKFTSKRVKVDLQKLQLAARDGGEAAKREQQVMEKSLEEDRKVVIQAAIVRIMKMRRRLQHNALITEVVEQVHTRFQPRIPMIKKCIDLLMEKEYLKRSEEDKDTYDYIS